jgi:histidyl-tRNA synthetase
VACDRPPLGRYREFYQCDADVVGSSSLLNEVELVNIYAAVFARLRIPVDIKINNRRILTALAALCGGAEKMNQLSVAIDKLDKIGLDKVKEELVKRGFGRADISIIEKYLSIDGSNEEKISAAKQLFGSTAQETKVLKTGNHLSPTHRSSHINRH